MLTIRAIFSFSATAVAASTASAVATFGFPAQLSPQVSSCYAEGRDYDCGYYDSLHVFRK